MAKYHAFTNTSVKRILNANEWNDKMMKALSVLNQVKKDLLALSDCADNAVDKKLNAIKKEMKEGEWDKEMEDFGIDVSLGVSFCDKDEIVIIADAPCSLRL